ncbi:MAG: tail fiber domain-containing protein [Bacteroidales bacterium]|nr:tail fiber domain-containing protein [Bacteroidales bacterium]
MDNNKQLGSNSNRWISVHAVNGTIQTSDRRLKNDIETLSYGLDQVNQLQPVTYRWKDGNDKSVHVGLIAQEVQKIIPEAVDSSDPDRLGLNYSELVPVLIQAIQELSDQVKVLHEQNTEQARLIRQLSGTTASISGK